MYTSKLLTAIMLAAVVAVSITGITKTYAQEGNVTGSVVVADKQNQVTILGQQGEKGDKGDPSTIPGPAGADGKDGKDGKDGVVKFMCFDANKQQETCPFVSVPVTEQPQVNQTVPPVVPQVNETGNVTETQPATNETTTVPSNETAPATNETAPVVSNETGNVTQPETAPIGEGLNQNGTIVLGGGGEVTAPENATASTNTTTTTTNTTTTTDANGTTTSNSTSETVPSELIPSAFLELAHQFGIGL